MLIQIGSHIDQLCLLMLNLILFITINSLNNKQSYHDESNYCPLIFRHNLGIGDINYGIILMIITS